MFKTIRLKLAAWLVRPPLEKKLTKIRASVDPYVVDGRVVRGGLPCSICGRSSRLMMPPDPLNESNELPICDNCAPWQTMIRGTFVPCASYIEPLDELIWLDEDVGYVSHHLHAGIDIFKHPVTGAIVGFRVRGVRAMLAAASACLPE